MERTENPLGRSTRDHPGVNGFDPDYDPWLHNFHESGAWLMNAPTPIPTPVSAGGTPPTIPPVLAAIPWYQSHVVIAQVSSAISGLVALSPHLGWVKALGLTDPSTVENDVTLVFGALAAIAQVVALIARMRSRIQPVTLTQIGADLHPNTLAVNQAASSKSTDPPPVSK